MTRARFICAARNGAARGAAASAAARSPLWRLVGANNRELGRMPMPAPADQTCCEAVTRLRASLEHAAPRIKLGGPAASWTWSLEADGVALAVSGRAYLRQRECQYSLALFLGAVLGATVPEAHCPLPGGALSDGRAR